MSRWRRREITAQGQPPSVPSKTPLPALRTLLPSHVSLGHGPWEVTHCDLHLTLRFWKGDCATERGQRPV